MSITHFPGDPDNPLLPPSDLPVIEPKCNDYTPQLTSLIDIGRMVARLLWAAVGLLGLLLILAICGRAQQAPMNFDSNGYLLVNCGIGCSSSSGPSFGSPFPATGTAVGFRDTLGNMSAGLLDASGFLKVNVSAGSGGNGAASNTGSAVPTQADYLGVNVAGTLRGQTGVNPSGSIFAAQFDLASVGGTAVALGQALMASSLPVAFASNQGALAVSQSGAWTVQPGNTANTTPWLFTISQGGNSALVSAGGALKVDNSAVTQPVSGTVTASQGGAPWSVAGTAANNASPSGNPLLNGAVGADSLPSVVTSGNMTRLNSDRYGRLHTAGPSVTWATSNATPIITATSTTIVSAPGAGTHLRVYYLFAANSSSTADLVGWNPAAGSQYFPMTLTQYEVFAHDFSSSVWDLPSNTALQITTGASGSVSWTVGYETVSD